MGKPREAEYDRGRQECRRTRHSVAIPSHAQTDEDAEQARENCESCMNPREQRKRQPMKGPDTSRTDRDARPRTETQDRGSGSLALSMTFSSRQA